MSDAALFRHFPTKEAIVLLATAIWTDRRYLDMSLLRSKEVATKAA